MAPRITAIRPAALAVGLLALGAAAVAPAAVAQSGTGLYEPFPEAAVKKRAERYVEQLGDRSPEPGRRFSDAELTSGVFVRPQRGVPAPAVPTAGRGAASHRAGAGEATEIALALQLLLLAAALALPTWALTSRARVRAA